VFAILLGFIGTPAWPWFQRFVGSGEELEHGMAALTKPDVLFTVGISTVIVFIGIGLGYWLYGRKPIASTEEADVLEKAQPEVFTLLRRKYFVDEAYEWAFVGLNRWWAKACDWLDTWVVNGVVLLCGYVVVGISWVNRVIDEYVVNLGFDEICKQVTGGGSLMSRLQDGRLQRYLRIIGISLTVLVLVLIWGCKGS
jgi:NADH:ubiquinone oxidoreductase subunit 5 (subunit L)/multisubunit Na+/H+ antiporter MnhA subunit